MIDIALPIPDELLDRKLRRHELAGEPLYFRGKWEGQGLVVQREFVVFWGGGRMVISFPDKAEFTLRELIEYFNAGLGIHQHQISIYSR